MRNIPKLLLAILILASSFNLYGATKYEGLKVKDIKTQAKEFIPVMVVLVLDKMFTHSPEVIEQAGRNIEHKLDLKKIKKTCATYAKKYTEVNTNAQKKDPEEEKRFYPFMRTAFKRSCADRGIKIDDSLLDPSIDNSSESSEDDSQAEVKLAECLLMQFSDNLILDVEDIINEMAVEQELQEMAKIQVFRNTTEAHKLENVTAKPEL